MSSTTLLTTSVCWYMAEGILATIDHPGIQHFHFHAGWGAWFFFFVLRANFDVHDVSTFKPVRLLLILFSDSIKALVAAWTRVTEYLLHLSFRLPCPWNAEFATVGFQATFVAWAYQMQNYSGSSRGTPTWLTNIGWPISLSLSLFQCFFDLVVIYLSI